MNIRADGLTVRFGGSDHFEGVGLALSSGEVVGLIGPNGAGKTTLLRVLADLLGRRPARCVTTGGQEAKWDARRLRDGCLFWSKAATSTGRCGSIISSRSDACRIAARWPARAPRTTRRSNAR